jgi:hypothetical protein
LYVDVASMPPLPPLSPRSLPRRRNGAGTLSLKLSLPSISLLFSFPDAQTPDPSRDPAHGMAVRGEGREEMVG